MRRSSNLDLPTSRSSGLHLGPVRRLAIVCRSSEKTLQSLLMLIQCYHMVVILFMRMRTLALT